MTSSPLLAPPLLGFLQAARVARLATADAAGRPSLVPICFQIEGARLFSAIDAKPKRADWRALQRVRNVLAQPAVAVLVDRWDEDWRRLAWVHLRGRAALLEQGPLHGQGIALLRAKYAQYREMALEQRPLIVVELTAATHWGDLAAGPAPEQAPRP